MSQQFMNGAGQNDGGFDALEGKLSELRPRTPDNVAQQMYHAGWAAAMAEVQRCSAAGPASRGLRWIWPAYAAAATLAAALMLVLLASGAGDRRLGETAGFNETDRVVGELGAGNTSGLGEQPRDASVDDNEAVIPAATQWTSVGFDPQQLDDWMEQQLRRRSLPASDTAEAPSEAGSRRESLWQLSRPLRSQNPFPKLWPSLLGDA